MPSRLASTRCRVARAAVLVLVLQGCGTAGKPAQQLVWVETPRCAAASCERRNDRDQWTLQRTPGRVTVTTSPGPLEVVCRAGPLQSSASAPSTVPPIGAGSTVAGAAVGAGAMGAATAGAAAVGMAPVAALLVVVGASAGAGAGRATEVETREIVPPDRIVVPLRCGAAAADGARFGFTVRGLTNEEARHAQLPKADAAPVVAVTEGSRAAATWCCAPTACLSTAPHCWRRSSARCRRAAR
jgi:hypothetical protein